MKLAVYILAALQLGLLFMLGFGIGGSDAAGNAMAQGFITLGGIMMAVLLVPALALAFSNKYLGAALILTLVSLALTIFGLSVL